jgi:hypothetical protein
MFTKCVFWVLLLIILLCSLFLHVYAIGGNNFHFTVDQGNDAVHVRDLLNNPRLIVRGPETSIRGVYVGPLWYYFLAIGYGVTSGNPISGVYLMIFLNLLSSFILATFLKLRIGSSWTLLIIAALQLCWHFFESALWSFNPFPLVFLGLMLLIFLTKTLEGSSKYYVLALVPLLLSFNSDLAGAAVFLLLFLFVGLWSFFHKKISPKFFLLTAGILPGIAVLFVVYYFAKLYFRTEFTGVSGTGQQVFTGTNFLEMVSIFSEVISQTLFPHNFYIGLFLFAGIFYGWIVFKHNDKKTKTFITLSLVVLFVSYLFFASNKGYRSWHIVYLPLITFISTLLMIECLVLYSKIYKSPEVFFRSKYAL